LKAKYLYLVKMLEDMLENMDMDEPIPAERDFTATYDMSRMTMRK